MADCVDLVTLRPVEGAAEVLELEVVWQIDNRTDRNLSLLQPRLPSGRRITHRSPWLAPNN